MTEHATTGAAPNAADLFEIIRTIWSMRRLKPGTGTESTDPKDPGGRRVRAERWKHAALAVPDDPRFEGQTVKQNSRGPLQARLG